MQTNRIRISVAPPVPLQEIPLRITIAQRGFTLIELAVVMFIVAMLLGGMLLPLSAQQDIRNNGNTQKILADARDALVGFAMANDRLPCPASATSNGVESFCTNGGTGPCGPKLTIYQTHGRCSNPYDGFVPAVTLGLAPVDAQGYLLDGWEGRIHYAVSKDPTSSTMNSNADVNPRYSFTITGGMRTIAMASLHPDLQVCDAGPATGTWQCGGTALATNAVATVFSTGKNVATGGTGTDEAANLDADRVFVSHAQAPADAANGDFDDLVIWLSPNILFNRMVAADRLP